MKTTGQKNERQHQTKPNIVPFPYLVIFSRTFTLFTFTFCFLKPAAPFHLRASDEILGVGVLSSQVRGRGRVIQGCQQVLPCQARQAKTPGTFASPAQAQATSVPIANSPLSYASWPVT